MIIRQELTTDFNEIYDLVKIAFETATVKDGDEQDYVNILRKSDRYIPQLSLVAEEDGKLIGHIMLTKMQIVGTDETFEELLLSPICVVLKYRSQGIGGKLIERSFDLARVIGYNAVFLCGDPTYYNKFGFQPTIVYGITCKTDIPAENVMVGEIVKGALQNKKGTIDIV